MIAKAAENFLRCRNVLRFARAHKRVVRDAHSVKNRFVSTGNFVYEFVDVPTLRFGSFLDLQSVFIRTGNEEHIVPTHPPIARRNVSGQRAQKRADVGHRVDVGDRRSDRGSSGH